MPFTVTHIAAAFPIAWLCRWKIPFSALAIGCMVCDLPVFFPRWIDYHATHSIKGLFTHCLPLGWLLFFIYHLFLKRSLIALLPRPIAAKLTPLARSDIRLPLLQILIISLCLLVGAATHVFWDSFTHMNRWGVKLVPVLDEIVYDYARRPVRGYSILQHGSSVVFLPIMFIGTLMWLRTLPTDPTIRVLQVGRLWKAIAIAMLVMVPLAVCLYLNDRYPDAPTYLLIHETVKVAGTLLIMVCGLYGLLFTALEKSPASTRQSGLNSFSKD